MPETKLIVLGGGGHASVVCDVARAAGFRDVLVCDPNVRTGTLCGFPCAVEDEDVLLERNAADADFVVAIGHRIARARLLERCRRAKARLAVIVHPSAVISPFARLEDGVVVMPRAVVNAGALIGRGSIVNTGAVVEHDCRVGEAVHVAPGSVICGGVEIGDRVDLGAGSVIIPGRRVGADAIVGAGSVIVRDVASGTTVFGNPARPKPAP